MTLGAPNGVYRIFVTKDRKRRAYRFEKSDRHELLSPLLEEQLRARSDRAAATQGSSCSRLTISRSRRSLTSVRSSCSRYALRSAIADSTSPLGMGRPEGCFKRTSHAASFSLVFLYGARQPGNCGAR